MKSLGYIRSLINRFRPTDRVFELEGGKLVYAVDGKCLKDILIDGPFRTRGKNKIADDGGVYKVEFKKDQWLADTGAGQQGEIDTDNAAINGACKNIDEAAKFMPAFIK